MDVRHYLIQVEKALRGREGERDYRELIFSRWTLEESTPSRRQASTDSRIKLGTMGDVGLNQEADKPPPVFGMKDYYSKQKDNFAKMLPSDITAKNGYDELAVTFGEAWRAEQVTNAIPNMKLHEIVDRIQDNDDLNYTIMQYYLDWQTFLKLDSIEKQKDFINGNEAKGILAHPRYYWGNLTPEHLDILLRYEKLNTTQEKKAMITAEGLLSLNPRDEWYRKHPEDNANLAILGQSRIFSREANKRAWALVNELDIPDSSIPPGVLIPKEIEDDYFGYQDTVEKWTANSPEAKLLRAKNRNLFDFLNEGRTDKLEEITEPIPSLEIKATPKFREIDDKLDAIKDEDSPDFKDNTIKDENGLTARDRARKELMESKVEGDVTYRDMERKIEAINKGTKEKPTADELIKKHIDIMRMVDKPGIGSSSAEVMLYRIDNTDYDKWVTDKNIWDKDAAELVDLTKEKTWRIDAKYRAEDAEYKVNIPERFKGIENETVRDQRIEEARALYLRKHNNYAQDRRRRLAYGLVNKEGERFPDDQVETYVQYYGYSDKGFRRERLLLSDKGFAEAMHRIAGIDIPKRVPDEEYDDIYDDFRDQFDDLEDLGNYKSAIYIEDPKLREEAREKLRRDEEGDYSAFGLAEIRRRAYGLYVSRDQVDNFVEYYRIVGEKKETPYDDDWFLMEHMDFYRNVYLNKDIFPDYNRRDFRKVPTREVYAQYEEYLSIPAAFSDLRREFREKHPELQAWGELIEMWKPLIKRKLTPEEEMRERYGIGEIEEKFPALQRGRR